MYKSIICFLLCILIVGCDNDPKQLEEDSDSKVVEPDQLEFDRDGFVEDHGPSTIRSYCINSLSWHVSMVYEIIDADTTIYFFKEGDEVKGDWFTIEKETSMLIVHLGKNKLGGKRYLNIKIESSYSKGVEISIKQHPDSKYIEGDESLTKNLIGLWALVSTYYKNKWWDDEKDGIIVEFLEDGTFRKYDSSPGIPGISVERGISYKINENNFYLRYNSLDLLEEDATGGVYTYNYSFYDEMFKIELIWGLWDNNTLFGYIFKRIKK